MIPTTLPLLVVDSRELASDPSDGIDSCEEMYRPDPDHLTFDLSSFENGCNVNPGGCEYNTAIHPDRCIHCGERATL